MLNNPEILVFTDFKLPSDFALQSAENIRKKVGGNIHVFHVSDIPVQWDWIAEGASSLLMSGKVTVEILSSLKKMMSDQITRCEVECTSKVTIGSVFEGLREAISQLKPDLIIMGHEHHAATILNVGSTVAKIASTSSVPVLVVKKILPPTLSKVAGLVDAEADSAPIVRATEEFSFLTSAQPEIISLWRDVPSHFLRKSTVEEREIAIERVRSEITNALDPNSKLKIKVEMTQEKQVAFHLAKMLEDDGVELAVMKRHQRSAFEKMFMGSETRRMIEIFNKNILILPP